MASGVGADLARNAGRHRADRERSGHRRAPGRTRASTSQGHPEPGYLPGMDIHAALTVVGDGPVGAVGRQLDRALRHAGRKCAARLGHRHEDGRRSARELRPGSRHGAAYFRLSRAGDLRLPVRASGPRRVASAFSCRRGSTARCAPPIAICSTSSCTRICGGICKGGTLRSLGRQVAAGIRPTRRTASGGRRLRAHRRRFGQHQRADRFGSRRSLDHRRATGRGGAGTAPGRQAVHQGEPRGDLRARAAAPAGWSARGASPRTRARRLPSRRGHRTDRHGRWPGSPAAACAMPGKPQPHYQRIPSVFEYYAGRRSRPEIARIRQECARQGPLAARRADGSLRLAADPIRWQAAGHRSRTRC